MSLTYKKLVLKVRIYAVCHTIHVSACNELLTLLVQRTHSVQFPLKLGCYIIVRIHPLVVLLAVRQPPAYRQTCVWLSTAVPQQIADCSTRNAPPGNNTSLPHNPTAPHCHAALCPSALQHPTMPMQAGSDAQGYTLHPIGENQLKQASASPHNWSYSSYLLCTFQGR